MNAVAGNFTYPPRNSDLQFDDRDSVVTSWVTTDSDAAENVVSLYFRLLNGKANWTISSVIEAVPANGSQSVALDIGEASDFLGQFNLNYNCNGRSQKYVSPIFEVTQHAGESSPVTWNQQALSTTSSGSLTPSIIQTAFTGGSKTTSATMLTGASKMTYPNSHPAATSTVRSSTSSAMASVLTLMEASKASNSNPLSAAAIGLVVGITFAIVAVGLIGFLYRKKKKEEDEEEKKSDHRRSLGISQTPAIFLNERRTIGELDAHQRPFELPAGRVDVELDGSRSTLKAHFSEA